MHLYKIMFFFCTLFDFNIHPMKFYCLSIFFLAFHLISWGQNLNDSLFVTESFTFETKGSLQLEGSLILPEKFTESTKIAILVAPPMAMDKDYGGMFLSLAERLGKHGIATFRFNNRAYTDTTLEAANEKITMHDHADDLHNAINAIKKDQRFAKNPIGLIGHSEGGCCSIIEASRNKDINFLVTLSTCGIDGADFCYCQNTLYFSYPNNFPAIARNNIVRDIYERSQIVKNLNNSDEIEAALRRQIDESAARSGIKYTEAQVAKFLKEWTIPRTVAFVKYNPETYLSQITCHVLATHGTTDGMVEWKTHLDGIEKAFMKSGKTNYKIITFKDTDHSYQYSPTTVPFFISMNNPNASKPVFIEKNWDQIANWLVNNYR